MTVLVALYIILAIVALIVVLFSIKFTVSLTYNEEFKVDVKWLFIKKKILPKPEGDGRCLQEDQGNRSQCYSSGL